MSELKFIGFTKPELEALFWIVSNWNPGGWQEFISSIERDDLLKPGHDMLTKINWAFFDLDDPKIQEMISLMGGDVHGEKEGFGKPC